MERRGSRGQGAAQGAVGGRGCNQRFQHGCMADVTSRTRSGMVVVPGAPRKVAITGGRHCDFRRYRMRGRVGDRICGGDAVWDLAAGPRMRGVVSCIGPDLRRPGSVAGMALYRQGRSDTRVQRRQHTSGHGRAGEAPEDQHHHQHKVEAATHRGMIPTGPSWFLDTFSRRADPPYGFSAIRD